MAVGLALAAAGLAVAAATGEAGGSGVMVLVVAAAAVGAGAGLVTPLGFAHLAATAPLERLGQTMGAAEVGRELGDAVVAGARTVIRRQPPSWSNPALLGAGR